MATTTSTSILSTPQAADDYYTYTEAEVLASDSLLTLDVMANDSGGKSKTLYSIEASEEFIEALKVQDATGEANAQYFNGVKVWIDNGKIMVDVSGADALAALGAQSIADLDAGQQLNLSFAYTIKLGNGTLSVATVSLTITGEGSTQPPELSTIGGDTTGTATEINAMDPDGIEYGVPTSTEGALTISGAAGVQFVAQTDTEGANHWGTFSLDVGGNWTYTTHDAMDFLAADETRTDSFVVQATDGTTQTVTVTIVGTDDEPRVTQADIEGQVTEGGQLNNDGKLVASGSFTITDPDFAPGFQAGQAVAVGGAIGTLHVTQTSFGPISTFAWMYTVDPSEVEGLHLGQDMPLAMQFAVPLTGSGTHMGGMPIYITVQGINDVPTITVTPGTLVTEDGLLTTGGKLDIQDNDDGESAFAGAGVAAGTYGQFDLQADGTWSYALNNDDARVQALRVGQSLTDQLVVTSQDGTASATLQVTIQGSNDGPRANADTTTGDENQTLTIDVLANDTDGDNGDVLTVFSAAAPSGKGTATVQGNKVVFDPGTAFDHLATGQSEDVVVTYTIKDLYGAESSSSVTITLTGTDDGPIARPDTGSGHENETLTIDVLANDSTPDRVAPLTLTAASVPQGQGSVTMDANQVVFNPGTDFDHLAQGATTTVVVSYTVADEHGATATGQATLTITGTNDGPVAQNDSATTGATKPLTIDVLANDTDPDDGDVLTLVGTPSAHHGTVSIVDNKLFYVPDPIYANLEPGQSVEDTVHYTIADGTGATSEATATVLLTSENTDHPIDNITGVDRGAILATITEATTGSIPTISGMVTFTDADVDQVYTVSATGSIYGALTASITTNANDPTLREITWTFTADTAVIEALGLDASDIEHFITDPAGFLTLDNGLPGGVDQIPLVLRVNGADDGEAVEINSPPFLATDVDGFDPSVGFSGTLSENATTTLSWGAFLSDPDGPQESAFATTGPVDGQYGSFWYDTDQQRWNYELDARAQSLAQGQQVVDHFDASSVDGSLHIPINVTVTGANDAPVASSVNLGASVDGAPRVITDTELLAGVTDVDSTSLQITSLSVAPDQGSLTNHFDGTWTYTPAADFNGMVNFSYTVSDGTLSASSVAMLAVTGNGTGADQEAVGTVLLSANGSVEIGTTVLMSLESSWFDPDGEITGIQAQWQYQGTNGDWLDIDGANGKSLFLHPDSFTEGTAIHLRIFTTDELGGESILDSMPLTLLPSIGEVEATGQLRLVVGSDATNVLFTSTQDITDINGGIVGYSFQWQSSSDNDPAGWADIPGATDGLLDMNDPAVAGHFVRVLAETTDAAGGTTDFTSAAQFILGESGLVPSATNLLVETDSPETVQGQWVSNPLQLALFAQQDPIHGAFGTLSVDVAGGWTYTADSAFDELAEGASAEDSISVLDANGNTVQFNINITGTNDAAQVSGDISAVLTEFSRKGLTFWTASGALTSQDVDNHLPDDFQGTFDQRGTSDLGMFSLSSNGQWQYILDANVAMPGSPQGIIDSTTFLTADGTAQSVYVTDGAQVLPGSAGADIISGGPGSEVLLGFRGDDILMSLDGDDWIDGGAGDDVLSGGFGTNIMTGGEGHNSFFFRSSGMTSEGVGTNDIITDFNVSEDVIVLHLSVSSGFSSIVEETSASHVFDTYLQYDGSTGVLTFSDTANDINFVIATLGLDLALTADNLLLTTADETGRAVGGGGPTQL